MRDAKHKLDPKATKIIGRESKRFQREVLEAIEIYERSPALNGYTGAYNLPPIYQSLLSRDPLGHVTGRP